MRGREGRSLRIELEKGALAPPRFVRSRSTTTNRILSQRRVPNPKGEAIYLSDGYFNLTLIPNRAEGKPSGLNHIGFDVDPNEAEYCSGDSSIGDCRSLARVPASGPSPIFAAPIQTETTWTYRRTDFRLGDPLLAYHRCLDTGSTPSRPRDRVYLMTDCRIVRPYFLPF